MRELQRVDERDGQREDDEVGRDVDAGGDVPEQEAVEALVGQRRIKLAQGHAAERDEDGLYNVPRAGEDDDVERCALEPHGREDAPVLQQEADFDQSKGPDVHLDGGEERLELSPAVLGGREP